MSFERYGTLMKVFLNHNLDTKHLFEYFAEKIQKINCVNSLHERPFKVAYNNIQSSFERLLRKVCLVFIQYRKICLFTTEICKV